MAVLSCMAASGASKAILMMKVAEGVLCRSVGHWKIRKGYGSMPLIMAQDSMENSLSKYVGLNCVSFLGFGSDISPVVGCKAQ